ncbi:MAG: adenosylcobinamide-GDP ribazoletransferase [Pseudomonadota bacterium]
MPDYIVSTLRALGFLSRIPIPAQHFTADHRASDDAQTYPLAGIVIAMPAAVLIVATALFPGAEWLLAILAVASLSVITGALHEDGLADVADGFFATDDRERVLEIMRDPHLGTFGTLALLISFLLRVAALTSLIGAIGPYSTAYALLAVEAVSRSAMVWHWHSLSNARPAGKAHHAGQPNQTQMRQSIMVGAVLVAGLWLLSWSSLIATIIAIATGVGAATAFKNYCQSKLGGHTGDTIGATQQIVALATLTSLAICAAVSN